MLLSLTGMSWNTSGIGGELWELILSLGFLRWRNMIFLGSHGMEKSDVPWFSVITNKGAMFFIIAHWLKDASNVDGQRTIIEGNDELLLWIACQAWTVGEMRRWEKREILVVQCRLDDEMSDERREKIQVTRGRSCLAKTFGRSWFPYPCLTVRTDTVTQRYNRAQMTHNLMNWINWAIWSIKTTNPCFHFLQAGSHSQLHFFIQHGSNQTFCCIHCCCCYRTRFCSTCRW